MDITITINCDNAAFRPYEGTEVARILREFVDKIDGSVLEEKLFDVNGNKVGEVMVRGKMEEEPVEGTLKEMMYKLKDGIRLTTNMGILWSEPGRIYTYNVKNREEEEYPFTENGLLNAISSLGGFLNIDTNEENEAND